MKTRHRIPTVFSIYMVDVLCCALGCVILLWQLYHHESQEQSAAARDALKKLSDAGIELLELSGIVDSLSSKLDASLKREVQITSELKTTAKDRDAARQLALVHKQEYDLVKKEFDSMKKTLAAAEATIALLNINLKDVEKKSTLTAAELAEKIRAHAELFDKLAETEKKLRLLTKDLALKDADAKAALREAKDKGTLLKLLEQELTMLRGQNKDTVAKLSTTDIRLKLLETDLDRSKKELTDAKNRWQELLSSQEAMAKRHQISLKDLEKAQLLLAALESDKLLLSRKVKDIQAAAENRFAGIQLTGQRIVFLVDMSGSMELIDDSTADPDKWPLVCDTIGRVIASVSDLKQYQVILFSDKVIYPLGGQRRWLDYESGSAKDVAQKLKAIKPQGGTDMYAGFEEAFQFRGQGLDTIYVFSDGLPNLGQGLPANTQGMTEAQKTEALSKHVRTRIKQQWNRPVPNQAKVRINTIGFFFESPDVGAFLWALAREHDGSFVGMSRP